MKDLRMRKLFHPSTGKILITPLDHGITLGPIDGIVNIRDTVAKLCHSKVNAVVLHKGNIHVCKDIFKENRDMAVIMHLSASIGFSPNQLRKVLIASVEEASKTGVDAVSIHINIGNDFDYQMIKDFGKISEECNQWGIPLIAMMYPRGDMVDEYNVQNALVSARVAMEIGADVVKVNYTDKYSFEKIVNAVDIPVVIAGGENHHDKKRLLQTIRDAIDVGASGVAIGRNVFQDNHMQGIIESIDLVVNHGADPEDLIQTIYRGSVANGERERDLV
ncbi:2-amino-3,7-dideoxy-D-threo-hept-6-ulosonate synthase [Paenibacillus tianjinensis]|uniref:Deoxyribose-phosphate aldolase n=1 Tax=Paenibacillus tianjinensis TaxID=2810347 RepID=A0ABX7L899_9BACL|nr:2-amino-3,7-dideoxy-D-threo-hept-6-ulosonate synthase [Paenibacillus tianjinensis]QSF44394.1 deoxyribose-phosphate aldolase [Paenibacillus tianjinensis]